MKNFFIAISALVFLGVAGSAQAMSIAASEETEKNIVDISSPLMISSIISFSDIGTILDVPEKPPSIRERLETERRGRVVAYATRLARRLNTLSQYYGDLLARVDTRVKEREEAGEDTYAANAHAKTARENIIAGRRALLLADFLYKTNSEQRVRDAFVAVKDALGNSVLALRSAHEHLESAIESLKASTKDMQEIYTE